MDIGLELEFGLDDPYPAYQALRQRGAVVKTRGFGGCWLVSRYSQVREALASPSLSHDGGVRASVDQSEVSRDDYMAFARFYGNALFVQTGLRHDRLRAAIAPAFRPRAVHEFADVVTEIADRRVRDSIGLGRFDLVTEVSKPIPLQVLLHILGVPDDDNEALGMLSDAMTLFLGGGSTAHSSPRLGMSAIRQLMEYFTAHVRTETRGRTPLLRALAHSEAESALTEVEAIAQCVLLLAAGHQTTSELLSTAVLELLTRPDQLRLITARPHLVSAAIDETLRFDAPVQIAGRTAREPVTLDGERIHSGERLLLIIGSAHRDPDQFARPDEFLVSRRDGSHLAFGAGPHLCLGTALARLEAAVTLKALLPFLSSLRIADGMPIRRANATFRRIDSLILEPT